MMQHVSNSIGAEMFHFLVVPLVMAGKAIWVHCGAAAVGHAVAGAAAHAGATQAAAGLAGNLAAGGLVVAEAGGAALAARTAIQAHGNMRLDAARNLTFAAEQRRLETTAKVESDYRLAVAEQQRAIAEIKIASKPLLTKFNDSAAAMNTGNLPSVQKLLNDVSHLPKVPKALARTIPDLPSVSEALINISAAETRLITYDMTHGHPVMGSILYFGKIYGTWISDGVDFWHSAAMQKLKAEGEKDKIEMACQILLAAHETACRAVADHCKLALETFYFHAEAGLKLSGTNRPWLELSSAEHEAVAILKTAHDLLVPSLSAIVETSALSGEAQ